MGWKATLRGRVADGMAVLRGWVGWNRNSAGMGGDGSESGRMGMEIRSAATGGDGCNFCPRVDL